MEASRAPEIDQYGFVITPDKAPAAQRVLPPCVDNPKYPVDPITGFRTVRMFISSTFRDMHGERDFLARFVLPAINDRVRKLRVKVCCPNVVSVFVRAVHCSGSRIGLVWQSRAATHSSLVFLVTTVRATTRAAASPNI